MYKKLKINKNNILIFVMLIMVVTPICINVEICVNDELWNFSNIYKMYNGFEIYKDINVIITPLFFYIGELLFNVFGANYLIFRIYNILIYVSLYFLTYKLFCALKVEKKIAKTYIVMLLISTAILCMQGANYNALAFDFVLLGVIWYIKYNDKRIKSNLLQGIALYLIFMTKQNFGAFYVLGLISIKIATIINNKKNLKQEIKKNFLDLINIAILFSVLLGIYVIYLAQNQNLYNAINFTILGMGQFIDNAISTSVSGVIIVILMDLLCIFLINNKKVKISQETKANCKILLSFAIPMILIAYPLCNKCHMIVAIFLSLIFIFYLYETLFIKELLSEISYSKIFKILVIIGVSIFFVSSIIIYKKTPQQYNYNNPYYGSNITKQQIIYIDKICNYIVNNDAKIISRKANFFMNILLKNNGVLDLPFKGNLGKGGEEALIEKIEGLKLKQILIDKETDICSQDSKKVRQYIQENYKYIDDIEEFMVYQKQ